MHERIIHLKEKALAGDAPSGWIELERIKARAWPQLRHLPPALRQARLLSHMLDEMTIGVDDDLIAGSIEGAFTNSYDLYQGGADHPLVAIAPPDVRAFWNDDPYEQQLARLLSPHEKSVQDEAVCIGKRVSGHMVPDFAVVLREGLEGILRRGEEKSQAADAETKMFYQAVSEACHAAGRLAKRYHTLASERAATARDPARRSDLTALAERCAQVPMKPARTLAEALQSVWFVYMLMTIEQTPNPYAFSIGRLDQLLYPFYARDLAAGLITDDDALELLEAFWLKFVVGRSCWAVSQNILIGGVKADGTDGTNPVSYLMLRATGELRTPQPSLAVRLHKNTPEPFFRQAVDLLRLGLGIPAFHNDDTVVRLKLSENIPLADARNYAIAGCQEPIVAGKENARTTGGKFNLAKCLELALNDGVSTLSGKPLGPNTGTHFSDFDSLREAFHRQVRYFAELMVKMHNEADELLARERPVPFLSAVMDDCLAKGRDVRGNGGRYNATGVLVHGLANVADSLMALKTLVFDEHRFDLDETLEALRTNFANHEPMRQMLLNHAPKYGNDIEAVDRLVGEELLFTANEIARHRNAWGGSFKAGFNSPSTHVHYGRKTGATPDGRKAGESLAYGTGPMQGRAQLGPTAFVNSVTAFSHQPAVNGTDLNLSFTPQLVAGEKGCQMLMAVVRTLFGRGAHHLQINIVDTETLRAAQKNPEAHRDLIVRIHGYSAYFTALAKEIQDDVIGRTSSRI